MGRNWFGQEAADPGEATRRAERRRDRQKRQEQQAEAGGGEAGSILPLEEGSHYSRGPAGSWGAAAHRWPSLDEGSCARAGPLPLHPASDVWVQPGCPPHPDFQLDWNQAWSTRPSLILSLCNWGRSPRVASGSPVGGLGRPSVRGRVLTPSPARSVGGAARGRADSRAWRPGLRGAGAAPAARASSPTRRVLSGRGRVGSCARRLCALPAARAPARASCRPQAPRTARCYTPKHRPDPGPSYSELSVGRKESRYSSGP